MQRQNESYRDSATEHLRSAVPPDDCAIAPAQENFKTSTWQLGLDAFATSQNLETRLHAVERVPSEGRGKSTRYIPIRFVFTNKLSKDKKLLLAFDAFVLSEIIGREVGLGKIIHGDNFATLKIKTSALTSEVRKRIGKISALLSSPSPPDLILNRHCAECEFQARCRQNAIEKDDLSLLAGMNEKERKRLRSKGIFTVTQLSYTFRPRRRPKRMRGKREQYHHSLKALAIREKKIHIVGSPELKIEGTPVYLDVEGLPDRDFHYLIGLRIGSGEAAVQHSLWANTAEDERKIWREFLCILETVEKPVVIHYWSYDHLFVKEMVSRYEKPREDSVAARALSNSINLVSFLYAQFYFPTYSNSLKEIAGWLGCVWLEKSSTGLNSIVWRHDWEILGRETDRQSLIEYNAADCAAVDRLAIELRRLLVTPQESVNLGSGGAVHTDSLKCEMPYHFGKIEYAVQEFESINKAGRWDYQRNRIYVRTEKDLKHATIVAKVRKKRMERINKDVRCKLSKVCPTCHKKTGRHTKQRTKTLYDLRFTKFGLSRWVVRYSFRNYWCHVCHHTFGTPTEFWQQGKFGRNLIAFVVFQVIELCIPQHTVGDSINRLFRLGLAQCVINNFKASAARHYEETRRRIIAAMVKGPLIQADETRIILKGKPAYVWVFATFREVVYFYSETREGDLLEKLLKDFRGVLVSDFYAAYDSMPCPQQKCLIHLMRDLNDTLLDQPFDEEVRGIVTRFAEILRAIVATVDRRGLKQHFLRKHVLEVERFYRHIRCTSYQSETALKCKARFEKNRDRLFTFLNHDGVPWNNNNVEHAIKAFARLRRAIEGLSTPKGIEEYLILLSICQTCKYMGVDFLDFLRSGEKDIHAFAENRPGRKNRSRRSRGEHNK